MNAFDKTMAYRNERELEKNQIMNELKTLEEQKDSGIAGTLALTTEDLSGPEEDLIMNSVIKSASVIIKTIEESKEDKIINLSDAVETLNDDGSRTAGFNGEISIGSLNDNLEISIIGSITKKFEEYD